MLLAEANKLDVDVLCWGGTHRFDAFDHEGKFFVNPGSATGAFTTGWMGEGEEIVPSFCLMNVSYYITSPMSQVGGYGLGIEMEKKTTIILERNDITD